MVGECSRAEMPLGMAFLFPDGSKDPEHVLPNRGGSPQLLDTEFCSALVFLMSFRLNYFSGFASPGSGCLTASAKRGLELCGSALKAACPVWHCPSQGPSSQLQVNMPRCLFGDRVPWIAPMQPNQLVATFLFAFGGFFGWRTARKIGEARRELQQCAERRVGQHFSVACSMKCVARSCPHSRLESWLP